MGRIGETRIAGVAEVVRLIATRAVHVRIFCAQIMKIAKSGLDIVEAVAVAPLMLAIPARGQTEGAFGFSALRVEQPDIVRVARVFIENFERVTGIKSRAGVGKDGVVVDDFMQRGLQWRTGESGRTVIIAGRRVSAKQRMETKQQNDCAQELSAPAEMTDLFHRFFLWGAAGRSA